MTQWIQDQETAKKQKKLCDQLAVCLEAVLEDAGYHVPTKVLEASERALFAWKNK